MTHRPVRLAVLLAALLPAIPALASMNIGQVFVKTGDPGRLDAAVRAYLDGWAKSAKPGEAPAGRRLVVLPPRDGWATLLDAGPKADAALAEALSKALGTRVIWIEVAGSSLSWRHVILQDGKIVETGAEPVPGWGGEALDGPMPRYRDVESLAWSLLAKEGVPRAYRFLAQADVQVAKDPKKGPQASIYRFVPADGALKAGSGTFGFVLPARGAAAPTPLDAVVPIAGEGDQAVKQGVDFITITGKPTPAALDQLAKTFAAIRRRHHADPRTGKAPFCHLVPDRYRAVVYERLARDPGDCKLVYEQLLDRAKEDAASGGKVRKPPPRRPTHPPTHP